MPRIEDKDQLRAKFARSDRRQDHGTRGTQDRYGSVWSKLSKQQARSRAADLDTRIQLQELANEGLPEPPRTQKVETNLKINRAVRQIIAGRRKESSELWSRILTLGMTKSGLANIFVGATRDTDGVDFSSRFNGLKIRPAEMKLYKTYVAKHPHFNSQGELVSGVMSSNGFLDFRAELIEGVPATAMERAFVSKIVREQFQEKREPDNAPDTYSEPHWRQYTDSETIEVGSVGLSPTEIAAKDRTPLTRSQKREVRAVKKQRYFKR